MVRKRTFSGPGNWGMKSPRELVWVVHPVTGSRNILLTISWGEDSPQVRPRCRLDRGVEILPNTFVEWPRLTRMAYETAAVYGPRDYRQLIGPGALPRGRGQDILMWGLSTQSKEVEWVRPVALT